MKSRTAEKPNNTVGDDDVCEDLSGWCLLSLKIAEYQLRESTTKEPKENRGDCSVLEDNTKRQREKDEEEFEMDFWKRN